MKQAIASALLGLFLLICAMLMVGHILHDYSYSILLFLLAGTLLTYSFSFLCAIDQLIQRLESHNVKRLEAEVEEKAKTISELHTRVEEMRTDYEKRLTQLGEDWQKERAAAQARETELASRINQPNRDVVRRDIHGDPS